MSLKLKVKLGRISGVVHTCEWCKYSTRSLNLFESHLNKCSPSASTVVPTVKKSSQAKKKKKYWHKCDSCDFTANMIKEMTRHKAKYHGLKVIPCKECDYLARNRSKLNRHIGYRHTKNKDNAGNLLQNSPPLPVSFSAIGSSNFDVSNLPMNYKHLDQFDFKLDKFYDEVFLPNSLNENVTERSLTCRFCGCCLSNEEQVLNHLQNFHLPNDCIEHEIQTAPVAGKRKSCEISLYKCTSCSFCSELKLVIVGHIIDCHPSCLVSTQFDGCSDSFAQSLCSNESSPKKVTAKIYGYSCSDCLYKTNFKRNLKLHRTHHGADAPFRCTQCNFAAFHEIAVSRHRNNYHVANSEKTSFNSAEVEGENPLIPVDEIKEEPVSDFDSKTVCAELSSTEQPRFEEKNEQIWQCSYCPTRRYSDHKGLLKHMRIKHNHNDSLSSATSYQCLPSWKCPMCPFIAKSKKNLKLHMNKRKHGRLISEDLQSCLDNTPSPSVGMKISDAYMENDGKPVFKCDHCPVSFGTYQAIAVHIAKAHKNEVVYKCHDCSFTSNRKYLLRNHLLTCSKNSVKDSFGSREPSEPSAGPSGNTENENLASPSVLKPLAKENNELVKYYGCSKCAYKTFRNFNLKKHIKLIHKGAKMIEILCQEEVHSNQDLEQKIGMALDNYVSEDIKNENPLLMCLDVEIKQEHFQEETTEPVASSTDVADEQKMRFMDLEKTSQSLDILGSEKNTYYSDSKRMKCYKCLFCPKVTRGWNHYILHRKMHFSAIANSKYKCKHCSYCSTSIKFLKKHEMLHKGKTGALAASQENCNPQEAKNLTTDPTTVSSQPQYSAVPPEYRVKSGYQCDACPFRAKDIKTFYVHKNLHNPRNAKHKCTKCTYQVDCISKLKVHSKVHTVEYLMSNYKSIGSKETREIGKTVLEQRVETQPIGGLFNDIGNADRNKQEEVEDCMETARSKHQIVATRRMASSLANSFIDGKLDKRSAELAVNEDEPTVKQNLNGPLVKRSTSLPSMGELKETQSLRASTDAPMNAKIELWHCERCPFVGQDSESLQKHITLHMNKRMYECVYCNYSVPTYYYLLEHMKLHQNPNPNLIYAQSTNNLQFIDSREHSAAGHSVNNTNLYENSRSFLSVPAKAFKCSYCPFSSRLRIFLIKHLKGHMNRYKHRCIFCTYSSDSQSELKKHCQVHFSLPGSDMNAYPESGRMNSSDGKVIACQEFNNTFMEGIYTQFNLNNPEEIKLSGDIQTKCEALGSSSNKANEVENMEVDATETDPPMSSDQRENLKEENKSSSILKSTAVDEVEANVLEENHSKEDIDTSVGNNESLPNIEETKKEDEEDLYIEIDDDSENCDDSANKNHLSESSGSNPPKEERTKPQSDKLEPWICKYCDRILKCQKSLIQHEAAHLGSCLYLKLSTTTFIDTSLTN